MCILNTGRDTTLYIRWGENILTGKLRKARSRLPAIRAHNSMHHLLCSAVKAQIQTVLVLMKLWQCMHLLHTVLPLWNNRAICLCTQATTCSGFPCHYGGEESQQYIKANNKFETNWGEKVSGVCCQNAKLRATQAPRGVTKLAVLLHAYGCLAILSASAAYQASPVGTS